MSLKTSTSENASEMESLIAQDLLGKRKRDEADDVEPNDIDRSKFATVEDYESDDDDNEPAQATVDDDRETLFIPEEKDIVPPDFQATISDDEGEDEPAHETSDEDSGTDAEDKVLSQALYDAQSEGFPHCAAYDPRIDKIKADLAQVPQMIMRALQKHQSGQKNEVTERIKATEELSEVPTPGKIRIALLGDAGAGKSSILNSLSDVPDLAKSLSGGQSCTCVPTEYMTAFPRQTKKFAAQIRYHSARKIKTVLTELLRDYRTFAFEFDSDWDEETHTAFKRKMSHAQKTFQVLFCDLEDFRNTEAIRSTVEKAYKRRIYKPLMKLMTDTCEARLQSAGLTDRFEYREAGNCAKLRAQIDPLIADKNNPEETGLWPLVESVRIGVGDSRLLEYVTLIDLPGMSDTNEARVNLTKDYVKTCDYVWVVAHLSRVVDDCTVFQLLSKYGKAFKGNIAVICTHCDDGVDSKLYRYLQESGQNMSSYDDLKGKIKSHKADVKQIKHDIKKLRKRNSTKNQLIEAHEKTDMIKTIQTKITQIENRRFEILVQTRNSMIVKQLQNDMSFHLPAHQELAVFCVSNSHYAYAKGLGKTRGARLDAQASGIPAVRQFALSLPASRLVQAIEDYSRTTLAILLKDMTLWVAKTAVDRRKELMDLVSAPGKFWPARLQQRRNDFALLLDTVIVQTLNTHQYQAMQAASTVFEQKRRLHPATQLAFIRKSGLHATKLCPKECWNEQFSKTVIDVISETWPDFENKTTTLQTDLQDDVISGLREVITIIKAQPYALALPMKDLKDLVESQTRVIAITFRNTIERYERQSRNISLDVTQHSDKNFFSRSMQPIYNKCINDRGAGVTKRSMDSLNAHLQNTTKRSPFTFTTESLTSAITKNDDEHLKQLEQQVVRVLVSTHNSFDRLINGVVDDPEEKRAKDCLMRKLPAINQAYFQVLRDFETVRAGYAI